MNEITQPGLKVAVLLPTYNGARFLAEQIESVLAQSYSNMTLYIRDDGSTDDTCAIIDKYEKEPRVHVIKGEHIGVVKSFFALLQEADPEAGYFAYCDQDDVWHRDKLKRAVDELTAVDEGTPALYFCRLDIVDERLNHLAYYFMPKKPLVLEAAIVGNSVTGMATVMNRAAWTLLVTHIPDFTVMHDWWTYIVVSAFGKVIYDARPAVYYRQTGANTVGIKTNFIEFVLLRLKKLRTGVYHKKISRQAKEFYRLYGGILKPDDKKMIEELILERKNFFTRLGYALRCPVYRQSFFDNLILKCMIVANIF